MNPEENPWTRLSGKLVYDNPWISVTEDQVLTPSKTPGIYGTVHFKNKAIGIIPLDENQYTWLVGQYRYPLNCYSWEIPMGGCPEGTEILLGAQRELREETGLVAKNWTNIMRIHTSNSVTNEEGFVFLAEGLTQYATEHEETEEIRLMHLPFRKAFEMVMNQQITDGISIAGILKCAFILGIR